MLHPNFKINGESFALVELLSHANFLQKSKEAHLVEVGDFLKQWLHEDNFITVTTSGSTGKPKNIKLQKKHMINSALATGKYFNSFEDTKALLCLSATYIAGKMMLVRAMVLGWDIHIVSTTATPLQDVDSTFNFGAMVPLQVENSLNKLGLIKKLIIGGAPISSMLLSKIKKLNTKCYATYGMTETITHVAIKSLNESDNATYQALPDVSFQSDSRGCLVISAPNVSAEPVITNDVVNLVSNTEFEWLGRYDNIINSGGVKLFPEKIEKKLSQHIPNRFFIAGIPDEKLGEQMILIIEGSEKNIFDKLFFKRLNLSKFEIPKQILLLSQFIETPTGKINRKETLKLV